MRRYEVLGALGEGAFGTVWRARDRDGGSVVALKRPRADDTEAAERLRREHAALAAVSHAGVVRVGALEHERGEPFFSMELVEGPDLVSWARRDVAPEAGAAVRRNLPMAFGQTLQEEGSSRWLRCTDAGCARLRDAMAQLAAAVDAIHAAGLLHLDLTPANVRVTEPERVVVLDLGLALPVDAFGRAARSPEAVVGSAPYMAPEHGERAPSTASDWYSVGVLLFEALTGAVPFEGAGPDALARKRSLSAPAPSDLVGPLPADLERACALLLARSPADRAGVEAVLGLSGG